MWRRLLSWFSYHTAHTSPFHSLFSAVLFVFLCFLLMTSLFKMAPAVALSSTPGMWFPEKIPVRRASFRHGL